MENVKALTSKKFINDFNQWIEILKSLGYKSTFKVLNSVNYGSCQNRERVYMVSTLGNLTFKWPQEIKHNKTLPDILDIKNNNEENFKKWDFLLNYKHKDFKTSINKITKTKILGYTNFNSEAYLYKPIGYGATLTASGANSRLKFYFPKENRIRTMTPSEAFEYMGFTKEASERVQQTNLITNTKIIFTCGNSISIEVLENIFKNIILSIQKEQEKWTINSRTH